MDTKSAQSERLKQFIDHTGMTVSQFGKQCGFPSASTLHNVIANGKTPSQKVLEKIITRFPQLNHDWVILGYGNMIVKGFEEKPVSATALEISTAASFGSIQQSLADHDYSLNELAKRVEAALERVDKVSEFLLTMAGEGRKYQQQQADLYMQKVDNKIMEIDKTFERHLECFDQRQEENRKENNDLIYTLDESRRQMLELELKKVTDHLGKIAENVSQTTLAVLQDGFDEIERNTDKRYHDALYKLGAMKKHKKD